MGSIQQVAMAAVCLVAAFAFGSFINQPPTDQTAQIDYSSPDNLRSLIEPETTVQKVPSKTPLMRPKLKSRLPMPSLPHGNSLATPINAGEIPPPSDLSGRIKPTQNSLANSFSTALEPTGIVADAPTFPPVTSGDSSMPVINKRNFGSSPNLAESMRAPFQTGDFNEPASTVENAPSFAAAEVTAQASPIDQPNPRSNQPSIAPIVEKAPAFPNLKRRSQSFTAAKPSIGFVGEAARSTMIRTPESSLETATRDQFRYSNPQRFTTNAREQSGLMPIPSLNQTVKIGDPGGAFGNRDLYNRDSRENAPQSRWNNTPQSVLKNNDGDYYPEQAQQRRVTRLPLKLNSTAQTRLTRLRDSTIQKISLRTTQFSEYVVGQGDSLQSIATNHFGKPDYYLDIYLANRDRLRFPGDLREGMSIKIPIYEQ